MEISIRENIFFFILLQSGTFLASCWPVVLCRCVLLKWRQTMNHIYIILPVSTLWYIICSLFNHALVLSEFLSQSKFPITSCESFWSLVIANFSSPKNAWSPPLHLPSYFPINQWNYFRNPHYRVVTKGIPLTTVVLFVEFIYRSSSSFRSHLSWYPLTPPTPTTHRTIACITMNWKVLRFSYDCHQRWLFV